MRGCDRHAGGVAQGWLRLFGRGESRPRDDGAPAWMDGDEVVLTLECSRRHTQNNARPWLHHNHARASRLRACLHRACGPHGQGPSKCVSRACARAASRPPRAGSTAVSAGRAGVNVTCSCTVKARGEARGPRGGLRGTKELRHAPLQRRDGWYVPGGSAWVGLPTAQQRCG